jgi:hypothetical protein
MFIQNAHESTLTCSWPDPKGHVRYYHHIASSVICNSLTLTLEGCWRGVYSVPSYLMGTLGSCPGAHEHRDPMLIYVCFALYGFLMFKHWLCWKYQYNIYICLILCTFRRGSRRGAHGMPSKGIGVTGLTIAQGMLNIIFASQGLRSAPLLFTIGRLSRNFGFSRFILLFDAAVGDCIQSKCV